MNDIGADIKLKVKYYKQDNVYTCGPVSLQMVFKFLGVFIDEKRMSKIAGASKTGGTSHKMMKRAVMKSGLFCRAKSNSSMKDIRSILSQKLPVIVNFVEPSEEVGHYAVVVGLEGDELLFNDPWNGKDFRMKENDFLGRWRNGRNTSRRWLMAVSKTPVFF